jgi:hypothetical protein
VWIRLGNRISRARQGREARPQTAKEKRPPDDGRFSMHAIE